MQREAVGRREEGWFAAEGSAARNLWVKVASSLRAFIRTGTVIAETNGNYSENEKIEWNNGLFVGVKRRWPLGHLLRLHEREDTSGGARG